MTDNKTRTTQFSGLAEMDRVEMESAKLISGRNNLLPVCMLVVLPKGTLGL